MKDYVVLEEIASLPKEELLQYIGKRAEAIVRQTQGESWDEDWEMDAVELAHAVYRSLSEFQ